jgi:hypothetical protein
MKQVLRLSPESGQEKNKDKLKQKQKNKNKDKLKQQNKTKTNYKQGKSETGKNIIFEPTVEQGCQMV